MPRFFLRTDFFLVGECQVSRSRGGSRSWKLARHFPQNVVGEKEDEEGEEEEEEKEGEEEEEGRKKQERRGRGERTRKKN